MMDVLITQDKEFIDEYFTSKKEIDREKLYKELDAQMQEEMKGNTYGD